MSIYVRIREDVNADMCALANIKMRRCAHMSLRGGEAEGMRAVRALRLDICSDDHVNKKRGKTGI